VFTRNLNQDIPQYKLGKVSNASAQVPKSRLITPHTTKNPLMAHESLQAEVKQMCFLESLLAASSVVVKYF
jgi:hypothetical protein